MDPELYRAAQEGNINGLRLQSQHFSTQLTPNKNTPVHVVALFNDSRECIEEILNANESLLFEVNFDGDSALHIAARNGKFEVGSTMITRAKHSDQEVESGGGKLESLLSMRNKNGNTPLHEAIMSGQSEIVAIMLQDYPEIANIANNSSETPLFLAVYKKRTLCGMRIMEYCPLPAYTGTERRTALHAAAVVLNSEGFTQELLKKHPTLIKMVDDFGRTALHYAARYGSDNVVKELLKMDKSIAYVVAEGGDNMTALHLATCEGNVKIMREILNHCPDC